MAQITQDEFKRAVTAIVDHLGLPRTRDKLGTMGAFKSRRGLNSTEALTERLFRLSGGLRMQVGATYGFMMLWGEMLHDKLGEDGEKRVEELADKVNACLDHGEHLIPGKEAELDESLAAYRAALAEGVGDDVAGLDMILKAVPDVAERLRAPREAAPAADPS
jgi:hypothetical protein